VTPARTFTLTPRNAAALRQYAELAGVSQQEFLNHFLEKFLVDHFGDPQVGAGEPFMGSFTFKDREGAERLAAWTKERLNDPELEIEVLGEKGGFKIKAAYISWGRMYEIWDDTRKLKLLIERNQKAHQMRDRSLGFQPQPFLPPPRRPSLVNR
jgi:hypothetical protein